MTQERPGPEILRSQGTLTSHLTLLSLKVLSALGAFDNLTEDSHSNLGRW